MIRELLGQIRDFGLRAEDENDLPARPGLPSLDIRSTSLITPKVDIRPPSIWRIGRCGIEAKDPLLLAAGAALRRRRFRESDRRWLPRASSRHHSWLN
jgi:hypothetical protein